ncbi:MAG: NAD(P)-dependent oxidoreductase [Xanthobacteraceae bacterium]|nr:NAD(P)-dependent oxidoreductase [Xanthobacteraceae bacterium]
MTKSVAILGANGVYARHLIPRLIADGHSVRAVVRRPEAANAARAAGAEIRVADIFDVSAMTAAFEGCEAAINLATTLPGPSGRGDFATNDKLRVEGVPNFVDACRKASVLKIMQQSIGWVAASGNSEWTNEDNVYRPSGDSISNNAILAALTMEDTIKASGLDWMILRGGLFYGPGTGFDDGWFARASAGKLRLPGDGLEYVSLVHIADMAAATVKAVQKWPKQRVLTICDHEPVQWRDLFGFICASAGAKAPEAGGPPGFPSFRLRNARAVEALDWRPFYKSYREGLGR